MNPQRVHLKGHARRSQKTMKTIHLVLLVLAALMICSCASETLPVAASDITRIHISRFPGGTVLADIGDKDTICRIFSRFSFGDKRHMSVKHPLPILIDLYAGTNAVCHVNCENRMMRIGNWEYTMSQDAAKMIQSAITKRTPDK